MNGLTKETWVDLWKPELRNEAGMIYDALNEIHDGVQAQEKKIKTYIEDHPKECQKKYITKTQMLIFILAAAAAGNIGNIWPIITKIF